MQFRGGPQTVSPSLSSGSPLLLSSLLLKFIIHVYQAQFAIYVKREMIVDSVAFGIVTLVIIVHLVSQLSSYLLSQPLSLYLL